MFGWHILGFMAQQIYQAAATTDNVSFGDKKCHSIFHSRQTLLPEEEFLQNVPWGGLQRDLPLPSIPLPRFWTPTVPFWFHNHFPLNKKADISREAKWYLDLTEKELKVESFLLCGNCYNVLLSLQGWREILVNITYLTEHSSTTYQTA